MFDANKIRNFRIPTVSEIIPSPDQSYDWFKISGGNVAFDYDKDIYTFGIDLTKSEAREVIRVIIKFCHKRHLMAQPIRQDSVS